MSLINEALKKAQAGHGRPGPPLPLQGEPHAPPHPPRRRHSYLFGFVVSLLLVGLFSTAVSSYLVWQFFRADERAAPPAAEQMAPAGPEAPAELPPEVPAAPAPEIPSPPIAALPPPEEPPAQPVAPPPAPPVAAAAIAAPAAAADVPVAGAAAPPPAAEDAPSAALLDPDTAKRLGELEIRGIMGLSRVLLHDLASGRSRAYRVGETVAGYPELVVESITDSSVSFKDHAGSIHTKPF